MGWQLVIFDETFRSLDCTPNVAEQIEKATGYRWMVLDGVLVGPRAEATAQRRVAAAVVAHQHSLGSEDALAKVDGLTMRDLNDAFSEFDDLPTVLEDGFPQSADEISTPG